jgi:hypothetical protein
MTKRNKITKAAKRPSRVVNGKPAAAKPTGPAGKGERSTATKSKDPLVAAKPALLAGGNPQIAKADGDAPVQAYIAAMPRWKRDVSPRLDALIVCNVPNVRKTVKWNSPFYGIEGQGWFLGFHVFTLRQGDLLLRRVAAFCPPASPSARTRAISTSTRRTSSTRSSWRVGLGRHRGCPAGSHSAGKQIKITYHDKE